MCNYAWMWTHVGKGAISGHSKAEVVYEYPDSFQLQEYRPMNDGDIELKECPAYEKPNEQPDIELVDCPAYVEKKRSGQVHQTGRTSWLWTHIESLHYYD